MLQAASKVAEMYIVDILTDHLESNNLHHPLQSGFRHGHSTQSLLLYITDSWYKSLDKGGLAGIVYLDITKAFEIDTNNHSLLLHKLKVQFYLSDQMCLWIRCFPFPTEYKQLLSMVQSHHISVLAPVSHKTRSVPPSYFQCIPMIFLQPEPPLYRQLCLLMTQSYLHLGRQLIDLAPAWTPLCHL